MKNMDYLEKKFTHVIPTELNMYYCGRRVATSNHSYGPQVRDHYLLVYIKDGNAILSLGGTCIDLSPGKLLCMFPNEKIYYKVNDGELWSILWVGVYGTQAELYLKSLGITRKNPVYTCPNPSETNKAIDDIIDTAEDLNMYYKTNTISKLYYFFSTLFKKEDLSTAKAKKISVSDIEDMQETHEINYLSKNLYIREAENYIRFHYDKKISVGFIADSLNLSTEYFSRLFKKETGMSPQQLIIRYRIERACTLLKSTNLSVSEISSSVGISDARYFSKLFRQNKSVSPQNYRKKRGVHSKT